MSNDESEGSYLLEQSRLQELEEECKRCLEEHIWTTKEGIRIPISEMSRSHLRNTLRMLRRWAKHQLMVNIKVMLEIDNSIFSPTAEVARDCFDRDFENLLGMKWDDYLEMYVPQFPHLVKEASRRGVTWDDQKS